MDNAADLRVLLASHYPLLFVETDEEPRFLATLKEATRQLHIPVWVWSASVGLAKDGHEPQYQTVDPRRALAFVAETTAPGAFVFTDANPMLTDPVVVRRIKEIAQSPESGRTLLLTATRPTVPDALTGVAHRWKLRPPGSDELLALVRRTVRDLADRGFPLSLSTKDMEAAAEALRGITLAEAERLLQRRVLETGALGSDDVPALRAGKAEILNTDGILELVDGNAGGLDEVGGLDGLKTWLKIRRLAVQSGNPAIEPPRGILLTGVPGCGKSLIAKALARTWGLPLVLLDPSRLYGKYVGESESRLEAALATLEAMAPLVLWIDEIEKGFATGDLDGGVARRLLGTFLRWLQEHDGTVFVVATANDVSALPPELLRKGRFDETFFVDLPGPEARRDILEVHLAKRGIDPTTIELDQVVAAADGFSGAELETAVVGALYRAAASDRPVTTGRLLDELHATVPLSQARPEAIAAMRRWATTGAVPA